MSRTQIDGEQLRSSNTKWPTTLMGLGFRVIYFLSIFNLGLIEKSLAFHIIPDYIFFHTL